MPLTNISHAYLTGACSLNFAGQTFLALPEKALFWPAQEALLLADLHLGKAAVFRQAGLAVPEGSSAADLKRLSRLLEVTGARQVFILGDFVHARRGFTQALRQQWLAWQNRHPSIGVHVILGNHDRGMASVLRALGTDAPTLSVYEQPVRRNELYLAHEPDDIPTEDATGQPLICGHLHPVLSLKDGKQTLRLPCYLQPGASLRLSKGPCLILPAYSEFTGGYAFRPDEAETALVVAGNQVIPVV